MIAFLVGILFAAPMDSTLHYFARKDAAALQALLLRAERREEALLCRYRLYPLTNDRRYLDDLPASVDGASARELALLAGLWGFRAARAPFPTNLRDGLRSDRYLERALAVNPNDPVVLLVAGQSALFRPAFAGGDPRLALRRFERLQARLRGRPDDAVSAMEAALWVWFTLDRLADPRAERMRRALLAQHPPPLFQEILAHPAG